MAVKHLRSKFGCAKDWYLAEMGATRPREAQARQVVLYRCVLSLFLSISLSLSLSHTLSLSLSVSGSSSCTGVHIAHSFQRKEPAQKYNKKDTHTRVVRTSESLNPEL